jgi:hypothetical protein
MRHILSGDRTGFNWPRYAARMLCPRQRAGEQTAYAGQAHWDIGRPQEAFLDVSDQIAGSVLHAG